MRECMNGKKVRPNCSCKCSRHEMIIASLFPMDAEMLKAWHIYILVFVLINNPNCLSPLNKFCFLFQKSTLIHNHENLSDTNYHIRHIRTHRALENYKFIEKATCQ